MQQTRTVVVIGGGYVLIPFDLYLIHNEQAFRFAGYSVINHLQQSSRKRLQVILVDNKGILGYGTNNHS
jgi:hypothetical protein